MSRRSIIIAMFATMFLFSFAGASATYSATSFTATYSVMGKTTRGSSQVSVDAVATVSASISNESAAITVSYDENYFSEDMPYGLDASIFILTSEEMQSNTKDGISMKVDTEMNAFYVTYGLKYFYVSLENTYASYSCKWEYYSGVLIELTIDAKNQMYERVTYRFSSASFDLYAPYSPEYVNTVNFVKALASPAGFILILVIALVLIIAVSMYSKTRKKSIAPPREARIINK